MTVERYVRCDDCDKWTNKKAAHYFRETAFYTAAVCNDCRKKRIERG